MYQTLLESTSVCKRYEKNILGCYFLFTVLTAVHLENANAKFHRIQSVADPELANGGPRSSAAGASIEAPKAPRKVGCGEGVPLPTGEGSGDGAVPPPQKIFLTLDLKMSTSSAF